LTLITKFYGAGGPSNLDIIFFVGEGFSLAISRPKGLPYEITGTYSRFYKHKQTQGEGPRVVYVLA